MKKFLCVGEPYESNGEKKMRWNRIGEIFTSKAGKDYAKLYQMPGVLISIFEETKKEAPKTDEFGADMETPF